MRKQPMATFRGAVGAGANTPRKDELVSGQTELPWSGIRTVREGGQAGHSLQNAACLPGPAASSEGLLVPAHPALDFQNVGLCKNCLGACYTSPITGHLRAQVCSLSIFAMNESDSACETLGRWSWDTLLLTSDGHLVSAGLCFRADISLSPQAPVTRI